MCLKGAIENIPVTFTFKNEFLPNKIFFVFTLRQVYFPKNASSFLFKAIMARINVAQILTVG